MSFISVSLTTLTGMRRTVIRSLITRTSTTPIGIRSRTSPIGTPIHGLTRLIVMTNPVTDRGIAAMASAPESNCDSCRDWLLDTP